MNELERAMYDAEFRARHPGWPPKIDSYGNPEGDVRVIAFDANGNRVSPSVAATPRSAQKPQALPKQKETGPATAGMDVLAGLLKGSVAATLGLPGDVESLVRLLTGGEQRLPTTEDLQKRLPPVVSPPAGDPGDPDYLKRNNRATAAEVAGEFIPLAPVAAAAKVVRKLGKKGTTQATAGTAAMAIAKPTGDRAIRYDASGNRVESEAAK